MPGIDVEVARYMSHFLHGEGRGLRKEPMWPGTGLDTGQHGPQYLLLYHPSLSLYLHWPPLNNIIAGKPGGMGDGQPQNFANRWTRGVKHDTLMCQVRGDGGCWVDEIQEQNVRWAPARCQVSFLYLAGCHPGLLSRLQNRVFACRT